MHPVHDPGERLLVLANWKAHLSPAGAGQWLRDFSSRYHAAAGIQVAVAMPCFLLPRFEEQCRDLENVSLAAQDVSSFPPGGYTGTTPAAWLADLVDYALIGHRERRVYFHETNQDCARKVFEAIDAGIRPVLCLGTDNIQAGLGTLESDELERILPAWTPDEAETLEVAGDRAAVAAGVKRLAGFCGNRPVLYGGGVSVKNIADLVTIPELAGVMVARGCLDPREFVALLEKAAQALADR